MKHSQLKFIFLLINFLYIFSAPYTAENAQWNVNFNPNPEDPSKYFGKWEGHSYFPSPKDWREESIYQFITDRFADGNPSNNEGKFGGYNLNHHGERHGGDFKGITNKLDYIKSLGFTSIWISPIFQNRENSYHSYSQIDFTILDDRFGKLSEFREMVQEAHKRNIKVIVDIVVNHMSDLFYFEGQTQAQNSIPFRFHNGEYRLFWKDENFQYADFKIDNTFYPNGQYCDVYDDKGNLIKDPGQGSFWNSDFHHNGDLSNYGDVWQNTLGKIYGIMDDLRTTHPRVINKLIAMSKALIASTDIDGFRVDTPMQVPVYFFQNWIPEIKSYAAQLGKKNFFVFGEFYCTKEKASSMTGRGKSPHMYRNNSFISDKYMFDGGIHYPMYHWFLNTIKDQNNNIDGLYKLYKSDLQDYDWYNPNTNRNEYRHLNFYDNHDQWRLSSSEDGFEKIKLSTGIIAFWPGIPLFYYGDEQGFRTDGTALDGFSREDFMTSLAWKGLKTPLGDNISDKDNFDMTSEYFKYVQNIMNVRSSYEILRTCDNVEERWVQENSSNGIFAFERRCGDKKALIIFNNWKFSLSIRNLNTYWSESKIVNVLNPSESLQLRNSLIEGLSLNGYDFKVFIPEKDLVQVKMTVKNINIKHDQAIIKSSSVNDKIRVEITFSSNINTNSIRNKLKINGDIVNSFISEGNYIKFEVEPKEGINFISIEDDILSVTGQKLVGRFISRFRYGYENNILINQHNQIRSNVLQNVLPNNRVVLNHFANGSEIYRVKFVPKTQALKKYEKWTDWKPYQSVSEENINFNLSDLKEIVIQYYVDNSAAYYIVQKFE